MEPDADLLEMSPPVPGGTHRREVKGCLGQPRTWTGGEMQVPVKENQPTQQVAA